MSESKVKQELPDMSEWTTEEIHRFWSTHDSGDYWEDTGEVQIEVEKRERRPVSVKLSEEDIKGLKEVASHKGLGHTTLMRMWIKEKLREAQRERES